MPKRRNYLVKANRPHYQTKWTIPLSFKKFINWFRWYENPLDKLRGEFLMKIYQKGREFFTKGRFWPKAKNEKGGEFSKT